MTNYNLFYGVGPQKSQHPDTSKSYSETPFINLKNFWENFFNILDKSSKLNRKNRYKYGKKNFENLRIF